ncbi:MAG: DUF4365 domain-containing protein [Candidatus Anammoximicrobium sp.]|nr:DUF4365 domain-containing protein [Candidatus Anammoximicrobium sp.]
MGGRKQIGRRDITGDKGIALIHRIVLDMGFVWNTTKLEAGIDGYIELRDDQSGEVSNFILQVQSKAGASWFKAETADSFEFICDERDLNYWLAGNAPVILVVSRPDQDEAYWVSIKEYFRDPHRRKSRKIVFNKASDRFDVNCRDRLSVQAIPADSGHYLAALPRTEALVCNLLPVLHYPSRLFRASTKLRFPGQVWDALRQHTTSPEGEWLLHGGFLYSFHDLTFMPWSTACLASTTQNLSALEWANSDDAHKRYVVVRMLTICMEQLLHRQGVRFSKAKEHYFFRAPSDLADIKVGGVTVFKGYASKSHPERIAYYRHRAMRAQFMRFDKQWYVEITPTYHFTHNGSVLSRYFEERLSGIKILERQNKVHLRQLRLWAEVLQQTHLRPPSGPRMVQRALFDELAPPPPAPVIEPYPHVTFGPPIEFETEVGLPETAWLPAEERSEADEDENQAQRRLF